jgi:DHA3 family macrolide efflux protein-like MFS transporter
MRFHLLRRHDFRRLYLAVAISELGDAFHYNAIMWFALLHGGPLGVMVVRLADSVPALLFGLHGGLLADRWDRRRLLIAADLARAAVLVPVAIAGLAGALPLWGLALAALLLETATAYFVPAYGALLPALVDRANAQEANALVRATTNAVAIGGWAAAAGLLTIAPISTFFAIDAATFFASAALIARIRSRPAAPTRGDAAPQLHEMFTALRPLPALAVAVMVLGLAQTVASGTWIAGVPELVRSQLHHEAGGFSLLMVGHAVGSVAAGMLLARWPIRHRARASMLPWLMYLPSYAAFALSGSLPVAIAAAALAGIGHGATSILLAAAAQEQVADHTLGRVMGLIALVDRGAHAAGLLLISPLFAVVAPRVMFAAAAGVIPLLGLGGVLAARGRERRAPRTTLADSP